MNKRRMALMTNKSGGGVLPSEYQRVEWIGLSADTSIDLGLPFYVIAGQSSTYFYISWEMNRYYGMSSILMYCSSLCFIRTNSEGEYRIYYPSGNYRLDGFSDMACNKRLTMWIEDAVLHSATDTTPEAQALTRNMSGASINLMGSSNITLKVYAVNVDGIEFIPCYRIADGEVGLYDTGNKRFLTNSGTGTITKGDDV